MLPLKPKNNKFNFSLRRYQHDSQFVLLTIFLLACNTMANFDAFSYKETISAKVEVQELIKSTLLNFKDQAKEDVNEFFNSSKNKFERWTTGLAKGELSKEDFKWLLESQMEKYISNLRRTGLIEFSGKSPKTGGYYITDKIKNIIFLE